jgi:pyridoxamine 5'-phosphate oxidase
VEKVSGADSDAYFTTRPVESRRSVYASRLSEQIESREALEWRCDVARHLSGEAVPRPRWWSGYSWVRERLAR